MPDPSNDAASASTSSQTRRRSSRGTSKAAAAPVAAADTELAEAAGAEQASVTRAAPKKVAANPKPLDSPSDAEATGDPAPAKRRSRKPSGDSASRAVGQAVEDAAGKKQVSVSPAAEQATRLAVREDEDPWTAAELDEVRAELEVEAERLRREIAIAEEEIADLFRDGGDGAGHDQADVGSTAFERDHEMSLARHSREMLAQVEHALARIDDGSYGVCESCGNPIGKLRLMAFPRATLCVTCKQREERR